MATIWRRLTQWMAHTEEAAKNVSRGDYAKAEMRLKLAIAEVRPFLPDTQRVMARSYCETRQGALF